MRVLADIVLCIGRGEGPIWIPNVLGSGDTMWANLASLFTGRYAHAHRAAEPGDAVFALTNLPDLLRAQGYRCRAEGGLALPFDWRRDEGEGDGRPLLLVSAAPVSRPGAWIIALEADECGRRWRAAVTPPDGAERRVLEAPISVVDLVPSICALLGLPIPPDVQGKAIRALWRGDDPLPGDYLWAYAAGAAGHLIWNSERAVILARDGMCRALDDKWRPITEAPGDADLAALAAAMMRAQDPLPYPQQRYRVKRHPDNLWLDAAYRQRTDPGIPSLPIVAQRQFHVRPTVLGGDAR